ncbi:MAG: hypothetical protein WAT20_11395 [Ferruginibacter sp.]|nr:hypothetical protein [Chitinophagaceae bacterium]
MKTLFSIVALLIFTGSVFAQNGEDYDELMRKSRRARTTSTIFVATGPVIAAGGIGTLIYGLLQNELAESEPLFDANGNYVGDAAPRKYTTEIVVGAAGALTGIALALTSIHFSNKASDLKREARRIKLKTSTERISIPGLQNGLANNRARQFKVSLIVPLGR